MLLSARLLIDVGSVNSFKFAQVLEFTAGDAPTIYFQLVDAAVEKDLRPPGRRYIPAPGATLQVVLHSVDDAKTVTRFATQPFATDPSIWSLALLATDVISGSVTMKLTLTEGTAVTRGRVDAALRIQNQTQAR